MNNVGFNLFLVAFQLGLLILNIQRDASTNQLIINCTFLIICVICLIYSKIVKELKNEH